MSRLIDLTGQRFGKLKVIRRVESRIKNKPEWLCKCDCGNKSTVMGYRLRDGVTKSCGCVKRNVLGNITRKHGHTANRKPSRTYSTWHGMMQRCYYPDHTSYEYYGARGITVCKRWHKFENFLADMGEKPHDLTLSRKNNNGNYTPSNCSWQTDAQQTRNKSSNLFVKINGKRMIITDACNKLGIKRGNFIAWYTTHRDLSPQRALRLYAEQRNKWPG